MKVTLISHTDNPLRAICIAVASMKEKDPIKAVDNMTIDQQKAYCDEVFKSKLRGALEFAHFEFMVEGVTRAFTHQLVRHRTMSFSQQSMRFFDARTAQFRYPKDLNEGQKKLIDESLTTTFLNYAHLIDSGLPVEDARSILPTNVQTLISFSSSFRGLVDMAEVRLCLQSQSEFREVMVAIKNEIARVEPFLAQYLRIACQWEGKCGFESVFDRDCPLKHNLKKEGV